MFTRQHYKAIAEIIRESDYDIAPLTNPNSDKLDKERVVRKLADMFQADNPQFNREKFIEACSS